MALLRAFVSGPSMIEALGSTNKILPLWIATSLPLIAWRVAFEPTIRKSQINPVLLQCLYSLNQRTLRALLGSLPSVSSRVDAPAPAEARASKGSVYDGSVHLLGE